MPDNAARGPARHKPRDNFYEIFTPKHHLNFDLSSFICHTRAVSKSVKARLYIISENPLSRIWKLFMDALVSPQINNLPHNRVNVSSTDILHSAIINLIHQNVKHVKCGKSKNRMLFWKFNVLETQTGDTGRDSKAAFVRVKNRFIALRRFMGNFTFTFRRTIGADKNSDKHLCALIHCKTVQHCWIIFVVTSETFSSVDISTMCITAYYGPQFPEFYIRILPISLNKRIY